MRRLGFTQVFDKDKIAIVLDHYTPCKDIKSAQLCKQAREFAHKHSITHFYDVGQMGVEHALLPEKGLAAPGEVIVGADSHTCTYGALGAFSTGIGSTDMAAGMATGLLWFKVPSAIKVTLKGKLQPMCQRQGCDPPPDRRRSGWTAPCIKSLEFAGEGVASLSMDDRFTISNMAIEAGGKNGIFPVDEKTMEYINGRVSRPCEAFEADPDAVYDAGGGHRPGQAGAHRGHAPSAREHQGGRARWPALPIDQVVIGSCTNGRIQDLRAGRCYSEGEKGGRKCALHRHPRHPGDHPPGHEGGADRDLHRGRLRRLHPHLRPLPGRTHGRHGGGGALPSPPPTATLWAAWAMCSSRSHPGLSRRGRRLRRGRLCGRPPHLKRTAHQAQWGI